MIHKLVLPNYKLIINSKLKYIHLTIDEQGELIVKTPKGVSIQEIEQLLHQKSVWIERSKERYHTQKGKIPNIDEPNKQIFFLGKPYPIEHFNMEYSDRESFLEQLNRLYKIESEKLIPNMVETVAKKMSLSPKSIIFRRTKRQWGSCSTKDRISFNTHIIKLPLDVIQYIIIHELSHIRYKHHQKTFWQEVEKYCQNYKQLEIELKEYQA